MSIANPAAPCSGGNAPDFSRIPPQLVEMARDVFDADRSGMLAFLPFPHQAEGSDTIIAGVHKFDEPVPPLPNAVPGRGLYEYRLSTVELSPRGLEVGTHYLQGPCTERCVGYLLTADSVVDTNKRPFVFLGGRPNPSDQFAACVTGAAELLDEILTTPGNHDPIRLAQVANGRFGRYFAGHNLSKATRWLIGLEGASLAEVEPIDRPAAA